jgi:HAMP domain-containing protein
MSVVFDVPTISVLVASASVIIGAIYYMLETRLQSRVRQTENVIRLSPWFSMSAKEIQ